MRITLVPLVALLLLWTLPGWSGLAVDAPGSGEYADQWRPDPMHEYWDPATYHRPETERMAGIFTGDDCLTCHASITPGIVQDWQASRHAKLEKPVLCPACHGNDHQKLTFPTPQTCGGCHPKPLAQMEEEKKWGFPSHALAMERAVDARHFADKPPAETLSCLQCHSVATKCDSCHTRHRFDPAEARRPEACLPCHDGPPHPDEATYLASAHGQRYQKEGAGMDWTRPLGKGQYPIPSCAYCHLRNGIHQVADKSIWGFGIREINPRTAENQIKRKRWIEICADCHPPDWSAAQLSGLDNERKEAWKVLYGVERLLKELRSEGLLRPTAQERPPYPLDPLARWWPRERIGFFEGGASAFYHVGAIERHYFELWYFDNPGAYKAQAHGATALSRHAHEGMASQAQAIAEEGERLRLLGKKGQAVDLKPLWMEGEYTRFNRENHERNKEKP